MTTTATGGAPASGAKAEFHQPAYLEGPAGRNGATIEGPARVGDVAVAVPGLLVIDCSWSMVDTLASANAALERFVRKLRQQAMVSGTAWLGIVTFADTARTDLALTRLADPAVALPPLQVRGSGTNFAAAFQEALDRFRADLPGLRNSAEGRRTMYRPTIYFVTDGEHNAATPWEPVLAELRSRSWRPNIMAFGYRDADPNVIRRIASEGMAYFAKSGEDPDSMFEQILTIILRSVISTGVTATAAAATATAHQPGPAPLLPVIDPASDPATAALALLDPITGPIN